MLKLFIDNVLRLWREWREPDIINVVERLQKLKES